MSASIASILCLSVSWEMRHKSSCMVLVLETESESAVPLLSVDSLSTDPLAALASSSDSGFAILLLLMDETELSSA